MKVIHWITLFILMSCQQNPGDKPNDYDLVLDDDGIFVEQFDSTNIDENRYNLNNRIYKPGSEFTYSYEYRSTSGERFLFKWNSDEWEFVNPQSNDPSTITSVQIKVMSGLKPMMDHIPEYNQTLLSYKLEPQINMSISGAIENEGNVWIHPPRDALFRILELNPFPYVKYPLEIGNRWIWHLGIGDHWADERWLLWTGSIENEYRYEITDIEERETQWGSLKCYIIESATKSRIGETHLTSVFNEELGFIELEYVNIDGSEINMTLINKTDQ